MTICKNCSTEFEGKYCPDCGQKAKTRRITTAHVLDDLRQAVVHFDRGFLFTIKELALRPGHAVRDFIEGKRTNLMKPVKFAAWASAISFLVFHLMGLDDLMIETMRAQDPNFAKTEKLSRVFFEHTTLMLFAMIPLIAMISWRLFRKSGYNYAEHFVAIAFFMGQCSVFTILLSPLQKWLGMLGSLNAMLVPSLLIWVVYLGWGMVQLLRPTNKILAWIKVAVSVLLGYFLLIVLIALVFLLLLILFPEWIKSFLQG